MPDNTNISNDLFMAINLASKHFGTDEEFNEKNLGLGIGKRLKDNQSIAAGGYRNSIDKNSFYAEYSKDKKFKISDMDVLLGLSAGLVSGYTDSVIPYLTPTLSVGKDGKNMKLRYIPKIEDVTPHVLGLQFEMPIK